MFFLFLATKLFSSYSNVTVQLTPPRPRRETQLLLKTKDIPVYQLSCLSEAVPTRLHWNTSRFPSVGYEDF